MRWEREGQDREGGARWRGRGEMDGNLGEGRGKKEGNLD